VILIYGVIVAIIAITDTALGGAFERLAVFANLAALILYSLCAIAAWNLRRRNVRSEGEPFVTPGGPLVPIAACLSIAWLFSETADRGQLIALGIVLATIFALYGIRALRVRMLAR
jgi:amino acid transporter